MNFLATNNTFEEKKSFWIEVLFYLSLALTVAAIFVWGIVNLQITVQAQKLSDVSKKVDTFSEPAYKETEKRVLDYKKRIDDLTQILSNRKISSHVFSLIEGDTLPKVWFSGFSMSGSENRLTLTGEAENMEVFSRQVQVFEKNDTYVKSVSILNSQIQPDNRVTFSLQLMLDPKIFNYAEVFLPTAVNTY